MIWAAFAVSCSRRERLTMLGPRRAKEGVGVVVAYGGTPAEFLGTSIDRAAQPAAAFAAGCCWEALAAGKEHLMADNTDATADNLVGVPEPEPPKGGPEADPDTPDPADLAPGLGGTSATRPPSETEDGDR